MCRDVERFDRNRHDMDALAPVLAEMAYMSGDIDRRVNRMNERIEREAAVGAVARAGQPPDQEAVEQVAQQAGFRRNIQSLQVIRAGFGSPLYNRSRLFVASPKLDHAAEDALRALRDNETPVQLVENTIKGDSAETAQ